MANLGTIDKQILEKLFQMNGGYVLNFSNRTMFEFFRDDIRININDPKYVYVGGSKANLMRGFWQEESDILVGKSIKRLIEYIESQILINNLKKEDFPQDLVNRGKEIGDKLLGIKPQTNPPTEVKEEEFISKDFKNISISRLGLEGVLSGVLEQRLEEIRKCLNVKASLAVIFLCGSTLEGILLGIASKRPKDFNQCTISPKDVSGKVKHFQDWKLSELIDVARHLGLLGEDVKKFSHALRDFRNYIHPYEQMSAGFNPDEHTARICWQVLQAAIVQLSQ